MVLDPLDEVLPVADAHHFAILTAAGDLQLQRQRRFVERERVVADRFERRTQSGEQPLPIVIDRRNLAVNNPPSENHLHADRLPAPLMAETDTEHRDLSGGGPDLRGHDAGVLRTARTRREHDRLRAEREHLLGRDRPVAGGHHLAA